MVRSCSSELIVGVVLVVEQGACWSQGQGERCASRPSWQRFDFFKNNTADLLLYLCEWGEVLSSATAVSRRRGRGAA